MPVSARARRGRRLQRWLAASFASLLAIAPFIRSSWTIDPVVAAIPVDSLAALGRGKGGFWPDRGYEWYAGI